MKLAIIDNHSVAVDLLRRNEMVLDAGARGFRFARRLAELGSFVVALDPAPDIENPQIDRVCYRRVAISSHPDTGMVPAMGFLEDMGDPEAHRLATHATSGPGWKAVCWNVRDISYQHGCMSIWSNPRGNDWDLVKLNVEGEEYEILRSWPGPIARQIVVSFHEHTDRRRGDVAIQAIVDHLSQWYVPVQHAKDSRYCAGENFWDSLFVLKELA